MLPKKSSAIKFINKAGILLVFPIKNKPEVPSLWSSFYPRSKMVWEWTDDGDDRVALIWHLRAELSNCRKVVYAKWYGGRATFFSFDLFTALLSYKSKAENPKCGLSPEAQRILSVLEDDSPLPTKVLRMESGFEGKQNEAGFNRALKELWSRLLIVGYGEVEEGGFPSLATGSTKLLFEELWDNSVIVTEEEREKIINKYIPLKSPFYKQLLSLRKQLLNVS